MVNVISNWSVLGYQSKQLCNLKQEVRMDMHAVIMLQYMCMRQNNTCIHASTIIAANKTTVQSLYNNYKEGDNY